MVVRGEPPIGVNEHSLKQLSQKIIHKASFEVHFIFLSSSLLMDCIAFMQRLNRRGWESVHVFNMT